MKAISTIIATVLLLMITIALVGTAYLYISGTLTGKVSNAFSILGSYGDTITIRNDGTDSITAFTRITIDNNQANYLVIKQDTSLAGYWRFDELNRTTATDSSGKGNQGTFTGETWNDGTITGATFTSGQYGSALSFDGVDDRVSVSDSASLDLTSAMTVTLWIKLPSIPIDERKILFKNGAYQIRTNPTGESPRISAFLWIGGVGEPRVSLPTADEETNNWMHLAITYDANAGANNFKLYKNGILKTQATRNGNIDVSINDVTSSVG